MERDILKKAAAWFARRATRSPKRIRIREGVPVPFPIRVMCRVLGLSPSGYYAWLKRPASKRDRRDRTLRETIVWIWNQNRRVYGRPRLHAELRARGERTSPKRVGRLMKEAGIQGASRRRRKAGLTRRDRKARPAPDLVNRNFAAERPDQLWVADLTYVRTKAGWLYVAVVLDAWSRRIVGWAMETHLRSELVEKALAMAVIQRQPKQVIHHSDQGTQYTSAAFGKRCREAGVRPSMCPVGDAYDNALCVFRQARFVPAVEYIQANRLRSLLMEDMAQVMSGIDAYLAPSFSYNVRLTNLTGLPCLALPNGFDPEGRPTSISLTGRLFDESRILALGRAYQQVTDHHSRQPAGFEVSGG